MFSKFGERWQFIYRNGGNPYLANFSSKHSETGCLVVTGATHHICYDLNWSIIVTLRLNQLV